MGGKFAGWGGYCSAGTAGTASRSSPSCRPCKQSRRTTGALGHRSTHSHAALRHCIVFKSRPSCVHACAMSPKLMTNASGMGGTACHVPPTCVPGVATLHGSQPRQAVDVTHLACGLCFMARLPASLGVTVFADQSSSHPKLAWISRPGTSESCSRMVRKPGSAVWVEGRGPSKRALVAANNTCAGPTA